jgi:uncharacterized protein YqgC (DUF456 family)
MHWGLLVSFLIGALCAIRLPALHFMLVVIMGISAYALIYQGSYSSNGNLILWCIIYAAMLQVGYVFSNFIFYLIYSRAGSRERGNFSAFMRSRYSPD